jgi:hypothetical protein
MSTPGKSGSSVIPTDWAEISGVWVDFVPHTQGVRGGQERRAVPDAAQARDQSPADASGQQLLQRGGLGPRGEWDAGPSGN